MYLGFSLPIYCERHGFGLLGEPLNLITNIAFLIAAAFAYEFARKAKTHKNYLLFLTFIVAAVGIGSSIFHAAPNQFTILLDALPIYIFIASTLLLLLQRLTESWRVAMFIVAGFIGVEIIASILIPASFLNGSIRHALTLIFVVSLLIITLKRFGKVAMGLLPVLGLYVLAITARSIDQLVCSNFSLGTHFLWHILNGISCYFVIKFLYKLCPYPSSASNKSRIS